MSVSSSKAAAPSAEKNQFQRIVGPIRKRHFGRNHAEFRGCFESGAIDIGCRAFLHPAGEIADTQTVTGACGIEIEVARDAGNIAGVGAGDGLQNEQSVFHAARHGAKFVERPAERHGAGARHAAVRWGAGR